MPKKGLDPSRWDKPVIQTGERTLTKRDVFNYYSDPKIRAHLLSQLQGNPVLAIQSLSPDQKIYKRNFQADTPIQITSANRDAHNKNDLAWFAERRFSEFHPVIRSKTNKIWVDIDPGGTQSPEELKPIAKKVNAMLSKLPGVKNTQIAFSGGRGFYVTGKLDDEKDTEEAREQLNTYLHSLTQENPKLTLHPPKKDQIRLDTSTLHDKGSIRALYSLNSDTGLASVPVSEKNLDSFNPNVDAHPSNLVTKSYSPVRFGDEYAPGIPAQKKTHPIPRTENKTWTMAVQEHAAKRAGKHWDLRLVDPDTGHAHSWAIPKSRLPEPGGNPLLAIQTPTHTARYALTFGENKPKEIKKGYGTGTVSIKIKEPIKVVRSTPNTVKFERGSERYQLFRTKDNAWLLRNTSQKKEAQNSAFVEGYRNAFEKMGVKLGGMSTLPLEANDDDMPVGALSKLLEDLPPPPQRLDQKRRQGSPYQTRMNQPTSWNSPMEISPYMAVGPSPILGYW